MSAEREQSSEVKAPQCSLRTLLIAVSVVAVVIAVIGQIFLRSAREKARLIELAKLDQQTKAAIVTDVEAIRTRLGRAPLDVAELEKLMGRPLPVVHDNGHPTPIRYYRTKDGSFLLVYTMWATDDWVYDSAAPSAGWVQHFY